MLLSGCADGWQVHFRDSERPQWVDPAVRDALGVWDLHGIAIELTDHDGVAIGVTELPGNHLGECQKVGKDIWLSEELERFVESEKPSDHRIPHCLVAHELGHMLGMNHVEGVSLMNGNVKVVRQGDVAVCPWSDEDQAELDRVLGR